MTTAVPFLLHGQQQQVCSAHYSRVVVSPTKLRFPHSNTTATGTRTSGNTEPRNIHDTLNGTPVVTRPADYITARPRKPLTKVTELRDTLPLPPKRALLQRQLALKA
ncbi:hypothetical protein TGPRC2_359510 [Toxoplasma gondii TgCatPRC2]|uniref:Uncharacterized protein n=1 Tax=Toxoplasma gondii TgCatPRC2 TaxID=1130821 RepID=A0A151H9V3_TOXGO|nr:hypothetical protein TGPRC2_359510 [Toxoplasma gondii TgCatPRC2]